MSTTLTPGPEINASNADAQRDGPNKVDHSYQPTENLYTFMDPKERSQYFQILATDAAPRSGFQKRNEQPMSKLASNMTLSSTEQPPNETASLDAKPWSRDRPSLPSASINGMLPLIYFKEKPNDGAKKVERATVMPQNHRGQTKNHRESIDTPAALLGGVIGSRDNSAEGSNQAGARDILQANFFGYREAPGWAPPPEPTDLSSNLPRPSDLAREMQTRRDTLRSSRENTNRLFYESLSQQKGNHSEKPIPSDLAQDRQAHREALRSSREKTNRPFYENLSQQNDDRDVENKPSSQHSPDFATKESTRQPLPQTPVLRPTQEQSRVASATLPDQQHQTQEADSETQLGKMLPLQSSASNVQQPSEAALLQYQIELHKLKYQAYLHGFGKYHHGSYRPNYTLSDDELEMIDPFTRNLATKESSAEPLDLQEELTVLHKLRMARKWPQKIVVTEDKRELQKVMFGDQHKQYGQAISTQMSSPLVSLSGGLQDIHATWSEPEVVKRTPVDFHCSQKKAPVDGSYLAEEERKVLDHVRGSMNTNLPVTTMPDPSSTSTGGNLEPAERSSFANTSMEGLQKLNDYQILRERMANHVGCARPIGFPLNGGFSQDPALEASTPSMAQAHKVTQTYPGQNIDPYKEQDAIMQGQSVEARSWNTTNMKASRIAEEKAKVFHARYSGELRQTWSSTSTGAMSIPSTAIDATASRIPVRESTVMPPLYEYLPCRPKSEKANVTFSRSVPSAPATCKRPYFSKMQGSEEQTIPSVSLGQHTKESNHDPRTTNDQVKQAKDIPNELNPAENRRDQRGQFTGKSSGLLGMFQDTSHGTDLQNTNDTSINEGHAESAAKPVVSNKLQLSEEKREQMIKEGLRSLRDFQRAVGSTESKPNMLATSHASLTGDSCSNSARKKSTASKILRSVTEKGDKYENGRLRELIRTLYVDLELHKKSETENRSVPSEPAENPAGSNSNLPPHDHMKQSQEYHRLPYNRDMLVGSKPQAINERRALKARFNEPEKDAVLSKPSYIVEREGQRMGYRDYELEEIICGSSLRRPEYTTAKINPPNKDSTFSKSQSRVEPHTVRREKLMSEFWSQPRNMTAYKGPNSPDCDSKSRSSSSPMTARPALYSLPSPLSTPEADLRSDIGGPDIDNWRMLVDFDSKAPSAAALAAARAKPNFNNEPILGSSPVKHEDTKSTSLPVFTRDVAYNPLATENVTTPSANPRTTFLSPNGIRISITGDGEARSADASTDVLVARDQDEDDEKGDRDDWTVLDSDYSSSRDSSEDSNDVLEAAPSEASSPSSMDVEVGDDRSEVSQDEWIIC